MKTEKEIRYMLDKALKDLDDIKSLFYKSTDTKLVSQLSEDWTKVETEIAILRWVIDEQ